MTDRLANALRRYERLRPEPREKSKSDKGQELADWIERDVGPVVDELSRRPVFRTLARWPLEHLVPGAASAERRLVEVVETRLVASAQALAVLGKEKVPVPARIPVLSATKGESDRELDVESDASLNAVKKWRSLSGVPLMEFVARKPWCDLASSSDFFGPAADINLKDREAYLGPGTSHVQIGEFLRFCNPRLRLLGDFVSRMLLLRVEHWHKHLRRFCSYCRSSAEAEALGGDRNRSAAESALAQLGDAVDQLGHALLCGSETKRREAAMALAQTHAAFQPLSDFSWLGIDLPCVTSAAYYRYRIEQRADVALAEQIAASLAECATIYRSNQDPEEILRQALTQYLLVIIDAPGRREAYWRGEPTANRWNRQNGAWQFLVTLAEAAQSKLGVDSFSLDGSAKDARSRIKGSIPQELDSLIRPSGRGTYLLRLAPEQICILRLETEDRLTQL